MSQHDICNAFVQNVSLMFPNAHVKAWPWKLIGESTICVEFASSKTWANGIIHNDPLHMRLLVQKDGNGWMIEGHMFAKRALKAVGVNVRKISGKTEQEVVQKLEDWFAKNVDNINAATPDIR